MDDPLDTAAASFKATLRELGLSGQEPELGLGDLTPDDVLRLAGLHSSKFAWLAT